jgi:hypothetical protein
MAKVRLNPTIEGIHGAVGNLVYKTFNHGEILGRMPDRTGIVATPSQVAQQDKFRLAAFYGKAVFADPQTKKVYEDAAQAKGLQAVFALAVADFLNAPIVQEVDLSSYTGKVGEQITIRAVDDVEVKGVAVTIRDNGGTVLEQGAAVLTPGTGKWTYTTTTALAQGQSAAIEVTATDIPGHAGTRTVQKP